MKIERLNLHGISLEEALQKTKQNLKWCLQSGIDVLDINHGKGHHSERRFSVIKQEIRRMLSQETAIKDAGYKIVYGESNLPITLAYDEGHTLIVVKGLEREYIGGSKQQEKNQAIFSAEGRQKRKSQKGLNAQKRNRQ
ncbi:MAG: Smr/MutS family protein [Syntrophomonas sp.]